MKKAIFILSLLFLTGTAIDLSAQIRTPAASPGAKMEQRVGLTDITLEYSRPSAKGRTVFAANGLVPFGEIWRAGANQATKITFSDDVKVGGQALKKGAYAILAKPGATEWSVMFYEHTTGNWGDYQSKTPNATVMGKVSKLNEMVETFTMDINHISNTGAHLVIMWADTKVAVPVEVEVDSRVMADINRVLAGPSANDYFAAATYLHESGKDLDKALDYVRKANAQNPQYWMLRREAMILADLKKYGEAVMVAEKSLAKAKEAGNNDYIRMNEASIKEWAKMK